MTANERNKTVSEIADDLQEPPARVDYIIRKLRIKPDERIGIIRRFSQEKINVIKSGLYGLQIRGAVNV